MNVALICPRIPKITNYGDWWRVSSNQPLAPPLGILMLSSVLKRSGHKVRVIDANLPEYSLKVVLDAIRDFRPDVVGISFKTPFLNSAFLLSRAIKNRFANVTIVVGGAHVSAVPQETMQENSFDYGVVGEGEEVLPELLEVLSGHSRDMRVVPGVVFRGDDGCAGFFRPREFIKDMDKLPFPDWSVVDFKRYRNKSISTKGKYSCPIITSRGCPYHCTFCDTGAMGTKVRGHSAGYVIAMLEEVIKRYHIREFNFYDATFGALKDRDMAICEKIIRRKWSVAWNCTTRIDAVDRQFLRIMKRAGCWQVLYGIESGSQEILDSTRKNLDLSKVKEVVSQTRKEGIQVRGDFIFGLPGDSIETIERTIEFACSLDLDYFISVFFAPYPGTEIFKYAQERDSFDKDWEKINCFLANFTPNRMTRQDLIRLSRKAYVKFYLRPKVAFAHLGWMLREPKMLFNYSRSFCAYLKAVLGRQDNN